MKYSYGYDFIVDIRGDGNYFSVQDAINAVPDFRKNRTSIFIRNGVYKEKLVLPASKTNVIMIGQNVDSVVLTHDDYASKKNQFGEDMGTTGSTSFYVFAEDFTAVNITFENSSGPVGQAVAVRIDGDRVAFHNCRFLGFQDTLYPHGSNSRQYYSNCYIEGTVDFIFGWSTAYFVDCIIHCKSPGYITAPSTQKETRFGFVFSNCIIEGSAPEHSVYLGRPWRPYGKSVFLNCTLGRCIKPEGWNNWNKPANEKSAYFAEYNNTGPGAQPGARVNWSHQLSTLQAKEYNVDTVLGDWEIDIELFTVKNIK
jgi:pectinesterase